MRNFSPLFFCALIFFTACQKSPELNTQPIEPNQGLDSAFLMKSITVTSEDRTQGFTETFHYDTVERMITVIYSDVQGNAAPEFPRKLYYRSDSLIERIKNPDVNPYNYDDFNKELLFSYDNQQRLSSVRMTQYNGEVYTVDFLWEDLPTGYKVSWLEPVGQDWSKRWSDTSYVTAYFSDNDQLLMQEQTSTYFDGVNNVTNRYGNACYYDDKGSATRYTGFSIDENGNRINEKVSSEFIGRLEQGTQLYDQRNILMHGISQLPSSLFNSEFGYLSAFNELCDWFQYSKTPFIEFKGLVGDWSQGNYDTYTGSSKVDAKGRLTFCTSVFQDYSLTPELIEVNYYKD